MKAFHDLREDRITTGNRVVVPPQGWSAEVVQQFKHKNAQPILTVCGDPYETSTAAKHWVEEILNSLAAGSVPLTCLTGRVARGYLVLPEGHRNFQVNPDNLQEAWVYRLSGDQLVWEQVDPASLAKPSTSVTGSRFRS